jgi:D-amino peptidase
MRNIDAGDIDYRASLITGSPKPLSMMQGIDESFDAVVLLGYHAGAGTAAVLSHTYNGKVWAAKLNSRLVGEIAINAAVAGYFGVPVAMVTGDSVACRDALSNLGAVETVAVKEPTTRNSANCLHPVAAREKIKLAAAGIMERLHEFEPFTLEPPIELELTFNNCGLADAAAIMPGAKRVDATTVGYTSEDFMEVFRAFLTMTRLAND